MAEIPKIAVVTRSYGGLEGRRVKAGTRFAIDRAAPGEDIKIITRARFQQLKDACLVRPDGTEGPAGAPQPAYMAARQEVVQRSPNQSRTAAKRLARQKNGGQPAEPRPLTNPALGSQTGAITLASLSPADQALAPSGLGLRGRRRSASSRSTTPTSSSPGPTPSAPSTAPGGGTTEERQDSKV